jgi:hypothetical protein
MSLFLLCTRTPHQNLDPTTRLAWGLFHTKRTINYHHLHLSGDDGMDEQQIDCVMI